MTFFQDLFNINFIVNQSIAVMLTALLIPHLRITSLFGAVLTVLSLSWINANLWNTSLFFSLPHSFTHQTLIIFLVNGLIFFALIKILPGIEVTGILPAIIAPIVLTLINILIKNYGYLIDWVAIFQWVKTAFFDIKNFVATT